MDAELTIKNYRCFSDSHPARFVVGDGFTGFLGVNNSGKSSLLKFFYELRGLFSSLSTPSPSLLGALAGNPQAFTLPPSVGNIEGIFCNTNNRNLVVDIKLKGVEQKRACPIAQRFTVTVLRAKNAYTLEILIPRSIDHKGNGLAFSETVLRNDGQSMVDFAPFWSLCQELASTFYIGPFRNAINVGVNANNAGSINPYYDIWLAPILCTRRCESRINRYRCVLDPV